MKTAKPYLFLASLILLMGQLLSCGGGGATSGGGEPALSITVIPPAVTIGIQQTTVFSATVSGGGDSNVTWSVEENGTGGAINQTGTYTAPDAAGIYHVIATSQADNRKKAIASVTVVVIP